MTGTRALVIALSLAAAACFAAAVVLQQQEAHTHGASLRLLVNRRWIAGTAVDLLGFLLQVAALHFGALSLVQPLLTTTLLFGMLLGRGRRSRLQWAGSVALVVGLAGFLAAGAPRGGRAVDTERLALAVLVALVVCAAALVTGGVVAQSAAAGISFAVVAGLAKVVGDQLLSAGLLATMRSWELYAVAATSALGLFLEQKAFAGGSLVPSLVTLTLADPMASLAIGVLVEGEYLRGGPAAVLAAGFAALGSAGVVLIARGPGAAHVPAAAGG